MELPKAMTDDHRALVETILGCEESLDRAMRTSDVAALDTLLGEDFVFTGHSGHVLNRQDELVMHQQGTLVFQKVAALQRVIQTMAGGAIVTLQLDLAGRHGGIAFRGSFRFTRVWALRMGQWRLIAAHASQIKAN